jgi:putative ABC transport system substrate-binding protein
MQLMRRRVFLACMAGLSVAVGGLSGCALVADRLRSRPARVGLLDPQTHDSPGAVARLEALRSGLRQTGWIENDNLVLEASYGEAQPDRLSDAAAKLVQDSVDVIVASSTVAALVVTKLTSDMPVVFVGVVDPVASGLVATLAHPGGRLTGITNNIELTNVKMVELFRSSVPGLESVAYLYSSAASSIQVNSVKHTAESLGLRTMALEVSSAADLRPAVAHALAARVQGLIVVSDTVIDSDYKAVADPALRSRLPTICGARLYTVAGGLMSYGIDNVAQFAQRAPYFVDRILRGANPGDLPVEGPTTFDFAVNVATSQVLGLRIPPEVAAQVTEWVK